jgi:hypothetical protein
MYSYVVGNSTWLAPIYLDNTLNVPYHTEHQDICVVISTPNHCTSWLLYTYLPYFSTLQVSCAH